MALPTATTVAAGAGAGTSPTVTLVSASSNDERGIINIVTGTTSAAGALATVTFSGSWNGYDPSATLTVLVSGCNTNAGGLGTLYVSTLSKTSFVVSCTGTPADATTYRVAYAVIA